MPVRRLIASVLEGMLAAAVSRLVPRPVTEAIRTLAAGLVLGGLACFALYNLYTLARWGVVFKIARRANGWIAFGDDPGWFLFWAAIYCIPVAVGCGCIAAWLARRRQARRDAFRRFVDGGGPAPQVRRLDEGR